MDITGGANSSASWLEGKDTGRLDNSTKWWEGTKDRTTLNEDIFIIWESGYDTLTCLSSLNILPYSSTWPVMLKHTLYNREVKNISSFGISLKEKRYGKYCNKTSNCNGTFNFFAYVKTIICYSNRRHTMAVCICGKHTATIWAPFLKNRKQMNGIKHFNTKGRVEDRREGQRE